MISVLKNIFNRDNSDNAEIVNFVNREYERRMQENRPFHLQWLLNIAFINGQQYLEINAVAGILEEVSRLYWWEERKVYNHIAPIVDTRISLLQRVKPKLVVRPGTERSDADRGAARVSSVILLTLTYDLDLPGLTPELLAWLEYCGTVVVKNIWDPNDGPSVPLEYPDGTVDWVKEGDIACVICPPQEVLPDSPWHHDVSNCRSVMHSRCYHVDDIFDIWGVEVNPEESVAVRLVRSMTAAGGLGMLQTGYRAGTVKMKDHAVVKEFWERPSHKFPDGRLAIVASGKLLYYDKLPYMIGDENQPDLPFVRVQSLKNPGCFWGRSVVERLIPLQQQYNALRNRKTEYLNRCSIGQIVYEEGSIDPDLLETEVGAPGGTIPYKRGFNPPRYMDNPPLPAAFETEEKTLLEEMTIISGVSEITRLSEAPPGVKSGVALSIALEQDETRLSQTASAIASGLVRCGKHWLRLAKQFVRGPRLVRQVGKQNMLAIQYWTGSDIRAEDVIVEIGSLLVESPAARRQMVFDLLGSGVFNDPQTGKLSEEGRARIFELLEFGDWESFDDIGRRHVDRADRENLRMLQGEPLAPADYDDHAIHIARHNRCRVSIEFEDAVAEAPEVAEVFRLHIEQHLAYMQQQAPGQVSPLAQVLQGLAQAGQEQPAATPAVPPTSPPEAVAGGETGETLPPPEEVLGQPPPGGGGG